MITSKMIERFIGDSARCPAARSSDPGAVSCGGSRSSEPRRVGRQPAGLELGVAARMKIRLATPVAATTSTEISPRVSQERMSTRVTLTMFLPYPNVYAAS